MAITGTKLFETIVGDRRMGAYQLTGDGSDTTWDAPVGVVELAWPISTTILDAGVTTLSHSGHTITLIGTLASSSTINVGYIGV